MPRRQWSSGFGRLSSVWLGVAVMATGVLGAGQETAGSVKGKVTCRGVRDCTGAIVYVEKIPGQTFAPEPDLVVDQVELTFVPHVLPVVTGTTVAFPNSDEVRHNVFSASQAKRFNLGTYSKGVVKHVVFDNPGVVELLCNVHAEMSAYVVVSDTPFFARTDPDGSYELEDVPVGTYTVVAWREELEPDRQQVTVRSGQVIVRDFDLRRR